MASLSSPLAPPALPAAQAQPQAGLVNIERNLEAQKEQNVKQTQEISGLRTTVQALRTETATLNNGIGSVSNLIQQDAVVEKQQEQQEVLRESRLAETKVRMGKESQLEQSITNALVAPVQALQPKISNIFDRIKSALFTLFTGWLTNQGIKALKASAEGNKTQLEKIKDRVIKNIGYFAASFAAVKVGFDLLFKTITGLTNNIAGFIIKLAKAPINLLRSALNLSPLSSIFKPKPTVKGPNFLGGALTLYTAIRNYGNGEITDTVMQGLLAAISFTPVGRLVGAVRTVLGIAVTADEIAEVFGSNIFGENPNILRQVNKVKEIAEKEAQQTRENSSSTAELTSTETVTPIVTAQTSMLENQPNENKVEPNPSSVDFKPIEGNPDALPNPSAGAAPTPTSSPMTSMMPQSADLSLNNLPGALAPGQRPDITPNKEQFAAATQARIDAKEKGLTGKELEEFVAAAAMNAKPSDANITSTAQIPNVGALPEPSPNVIMAGGQGDSQQSPSLQSPPVESDTPIINSSNPDNFYVLYSQLNYNVVI
jgi:hypothetical protein